MKILHGSSNISWNGFHTDKILNFRHVTVVCDTPSCDSGLYNTPLLPYLTIVEVPPTLQSVKSFLCDSLRWLDTVFKNSGVQQFDRFKLRIFRIYSADIGVFIYFDISTFKLH